MKGIMYHYVRPTMEGFPYFRYLHLDNFLQQLDWFAANFQAVSRLSFEQALQGGAFPHNGILLTFDDGFSDHVLHAFPALKRSNSWGIFYVATGVYRTRKLLDVHRIHLLLGRYGGDEALKRLLPLVKDDMLSHNNVDDFHKETYKRQVNNESTTLFKRTMNYFISYQWREQLLDYLMQDFLSGDSESELVDRVYLSPDQIRFMHQQGMVIGSHSVNHPVFSKLTHDDQKTELVESLDFLANVIGEPVTTFCYPYGGFHSFTEETERLLSQLGIRYSFNVEARDIQPDDLLKRPQALPRYDCNQFPFGRASMGHHCVPTDEVTGAG